MTPRRLISKMTPQLLKNFYHLLEAVIACSYYGFPGSHIKVIGVTGTNGKTTTCQLITKILEKAGGRVAMATTINFKIAEKEWANTSKFTTLSTWKVQRFLKQAVEAQCQYAVLETSSHALDQNRVWGIPYAISVITNVTHEHLDYHHNMKSYRKAKRKLFQRAKNLVINLDMDEPEYFHVDDKLALFYSTKNPGAHILAQNISLDFKGTEFTVDGTRFKLKLPGLFNIENALAALGVARLLNIDLVTAKSALEEVDGVPGRMQVLPAPNKADVIIDYAVTPDAFEKLYASILPLRIPGTKIIHVFGACGERDRIKRPILGEIASGYADIVILTNEDPYHEDPEHILDDIEKGITKTQGKNYFRIFDRREAIVRALELSEIGDIVLVTGKGAEETMALGDERVPWNDKQVVEEAFQKMSPAA